MVLRLPAASRQQPAWLRRAPLWRRTTRCSGMPLRPSPRQSDLAQPDWTLEAHTATTLRRISPLAKSGTAAARWLPAASSQQPAWLRRAPLWRRTTRCSGTPSRPSPRQSHLALPGWPLAAGRWKPAQPRHFDASHLWRSRGRRRQHGYQRPVASLVAARTSVEANDPVQWHSITPITTPFTPGTTWLAAGRWPLEAHTATTLRRISPLAKSGTAAALWLPAASSQPGCGAHLCGGERPGAAALHHANHTWHNLAGRWPLAAGSSTQQDPRGLRPTPHGWPVPGAPSARRSPCARSGSPSRSATSSSRWAGREHGPSHATGPGRAPPPTA